MQFGPGYYEGEEIWRQMRIELRRNGVRLHNNHWGKTEFYLEVYDRLGKDGTTVAGTASALGKSVDTIKQAHKAARQRIFGFDTASATESSWPWLRARPRPGDWLRMLVRLFQGRPIFTNRDGSFCWSVTDESFSLRKN